MFHYDNENMLYPTNRTIQNKKEQIEEYNFPIPQNSYIYNNRKNFATIPNYKKHNKLDLQTKEDSISELKESKNTNLNTESTIPPIIPSHRYIKPNTNQLCAKVIIENCHSYSDVIYTLDNFLSKKNIKTHYETSYELNKIILSFQDEKIAFEFTKLINYKKNNNPAFNNVIVHLSLSPNEANEKTIIHNKIKKKGLSYESIMRLVNGNSYIKKEKPLPKILGNAKIGMKLSFYNARNGKKYRINKTKSVNSIDEKHLLRNIGYDGKPLKSYENLKISVLNTRYKPILTKIVRNDNKNKWISPVNFKFY